LLEEIVIVLKKTVNYINYLTATGVKNKILNIFLNNSTPLEFFLYITKVITVINNIFIIMYFNLSNKLSSYFLHLL